MLPNIAVNYRLCVITRPNDFTIAQIVKEAGYKSVTIAMARKCLLLTEKSGNIG